MLQIESKKERKENWMEKLERGLTEREANQFLLEIKEYTKDNELKKFIEKLLKV